MKKSIERCRAGFAPLNVQEVFLLEEIVDFFEIHGEKSTKKVKKELVSPELLECLVFKFGFRVHFRDKHYVLEGMPQE